MSLSKIPGHSFRPMYVEKRVIFFMESSCSKGLPHGRGNISHVFLLLKFDIYRAGAGCWNGCGVTRLGELSPIGQFISLEHFLDNCRMSTSFCAAFSTLTRNVLGYTWAYWAFFHKLIWSPWKGVNTKQSLGWNHSRKLRLLRYR
jgi:hypothetical protein